MTLFSKFPCGNFEAFFERLRSNNNSVGNRAIPQGDTSYMSFDVMEEGIPCDYCGQPVGFMDDDWAVCPSCRTEYINMDFEGGDLESESPLEY